MTGLQWRGPGKEAPLCCHPLPPHGGLGTREGRARVNAHPMAPQGRARRRPSQGWAGSTPARLAGVLVGACHLPLTQVPGRL